MSTTVPLRYNDPSYIQGTAGQGKDLLIASGLGIRPAIGGYKRRSHKKRGGKRITVKRNQTQKRRVKKTKGGFIPSVMEPFVSSVSKYIVPLVLYSGYKLMTRNKKQSKRRTHRK